MTDKGSYYLCFRFNGADSEGTESITFVVGGSHRGGIAEGKLSWVGGTSPTVAAAIADRVTRWVDHEVRGQQLLSFMDPVAAGDPPIW